MLRGLTMDTINPHLRKMEYAVRGQLVIRAEELDAQLQAGGSLPFPEVVECNIGNPQALGQQPITFFRQVLSLAINPSLLDEPAIADIYPVDVLDRAREILESTGSIGAYTHSKGIPSVREDVAAFIEARDGYAANPNHIFLTDGASPAVQSVIHTAIRDENDGLLIPTPQYPLYSATIAAAGGAQVGYYLDEENEWGLEVAELERALTKAKSSGINVRAMVVINPGNPTGQCMTEDNIAEVLDFAYSNGLAVCADEVYQTNTYVKDRPFHSFKKVLRSMGDAYRDQQLFSFHSVSKGVLGECGLRGGYMEVVGASDELLDQFYKNASVHLCANTVGQLTVGLMVRPPVEGEPSYELYASEWAAQFESLQRRAATLVEGLNSMPGITCNQAAGAMYAFPSIRIPQRAMKEAEKQGIPPDTYYCLQLLDNTGICVVPGSGFGQRDGTYHFRTTFLPPEDKMDAVIQRMRTWHARFFEHWGD